MSKKYHKIGTMVERRDKETREPILDKDGKKTYYLKVDKNVNITINGKKVPAGGYLNVKRPYDYDYRQFHVTGKLSEQEYEEKRSQFEKGGEKDYLQFEFEFVSED
jgi:hypothetical protein